MTPSSYGDTKARGRINLGVLSVPPMNRNVVKALPHANALSLLQDARTVFCGVTRMTLAALLGDVAACTGSLSSMMVGESKAFSVVRRLHLDDESEVLGKL